MYRMFAGALVAGLVAVGLTLPAAAQTVSSADIQRLQQALNQAGSEIAELRQRDPAEARRLQAEFDELQDEVIYLRVSVQRQRTVPRTEYTEVRDRIDQLRSRARGEATAPAAAPTPATGETRAPVRPDATAPNTVPVGTELDVRLQTPLNSGRAQVEDRFEATTLVDLAQNGRVLIPAGSMVRGIVTGVTSAGRIERKGSLTLSFDQITITGRNYPIRATVTQALEAGGYREDAEKIGAGAAVGGVIGGILGGFRGVLTGILVGGGGVIAATEGQQVDLQPGTVLRMRLDTPITVNR